MFFPAPLQPAILLQRYKRFLADIQFDDGRIVTAHCPNPGAMLGVAPQGARCWVSPAHNPKRKLQWTLELVEVSSFGKSVLTGINTSHPNQLAHEAIEKGLIAPLAGFATLRREVRYGQNSRIDLLLEDGVKGPCHVEVKNVHLLRREGLAEFPDSVTRRGAKHLQEMTALVKQGQRAAMLYVIQREDCSAMGLADDLDPAYAEAFRTAREAGVEAYALRCRIDPETIEPLDLVPVKESL
jgi:sugar fermentation stimulation protein A